MTEAQFVFGCGIPGHPENYSHMHYGGWRDCPDCWAHLSSLVVAACASVGIERNRDTEVVLDDYMSGYHEHHQPRKESD